MTANAAHGQDDFPTPAQRRRRNRADVTDAILAAARAVMRAQGVGALNLQEVARRVGMRAPSLYEYFPNKAAIYDALFLRGTGLFGEYMTRAVAPRAGDDDPWATFRRAMQAYMAFAVDHPDLYQLVFERPVPGFTPSPASMEVSSGVLAGAIQAIAAAEEAGVLAPGLPPAQAFDLLNAMMHGLTALHMANEPDQPAGTGRFGALIPAAMTLFQKAWSPADAALASPQALGDEAPETRGGKES